MNKIGFQNFRRFQNFPTLECGPITFLVGRNNSGKSTLVKALMLVNNYLKSGELLGFPIGENILEEVNIVSYGRALHQPERENCIRFFSSYDEFDIQITITGGKSDTKANVTQIVITDNQNLIEFDYNWKTFSAKKRMVKSKTEEESVELLKKVENEIAKHEAMLVDLGGKKSSREYLELIDFLNQLRAKRDDLLIKTNSERKGKNYSEYSISVQIDYADSFIDLFDSFLSTAFAVYKKGSDAVHGGEDQPENFENFRAFYEDQQIFESSIDRFLEVTSNIKFVYLSANSSKQAALLFIRDKKNELAQSVHEHYTGLHAHDGFIKTWMKELEVGEAFEIKSHAGEAYEVLIKTEDGWIQLADMGLGSIQAMQLILRIANILDGDIYEKVTSETSRLVTVFIEEPELNLHPALQSKLADMFFEAFDKYNVRFIIETHSEYLIRKTQLLVKGKELEIKPNENPFCVIYFDKDKQWKMNYREDGKFIEDFGEGFYDESALLTLNLF